MDQDSTSACAQAASDAWASTAAEDTCTSWQGQLLELSSSCWLPSTKVAQVTHLAGGNAQLPAAVLNTIQLYACWTFHWCLVVYECLLLQLAPIIIRCQQACRGQVQVRHRARVDSNKEGMPVLTESARKKKEKQMHGIECNTDWHAVRRYS